MVDLYALKFGARLCAANSKNFWCCFLPFTQPSAGFFMCGFIACEPHFYLKMRCAILCNHINFYNLSMSISPKLAYTLDQIADAYTPLLLVIALLDLVLRWRDGDKLHSLKLSYAVAVVYGWMFIDNRFQLWHSLGLDYSTHTAAALVLVIGIAMRKRLAVKIVLGSSLVLYGCLMSLLSYHTWPDMLATATIIALCVLPVMVLRTRFAPKLWAAS